MTRPRKSILLGWLVAFVMTAGAFAAPGVAWADDDEEEQNFAVGEWAFKRLNEAHELLADGKYDDAASALEPMRRRKRLNDHERALMWQAYGYVYAGLERPKDALTAFEHALSQNALPAPTILEMRYTIAQLYLVTKQYGKAASALETWMKQADNPSPQAKYLLSMAYVQKKDYKKALPWALQAIGGVKEPQESWLQLLLAIRFELDQKDKLVTLLEEMVARFGKKEYWLQLAQLYSVKGEQDKAMAALELSYMQGFLNSGGELSNLAIYYINFGVPYKAGKVMAKGIEAGLIEKDLRSLTLLADAWMRAKAYDLAIPVLNEAGAMAPDGELYLRLGQMHAEEAQWNEAVKALNAALAKGGLRDPGNAYVLLGMAAFRAERTSQARQAFAKAAGFKNTKDVATSWLQML